MFPSLHLRVLALALLVGACTQSSGTAPPVASGLPSAGFVQVPDEAAGVVHRVDTFGRDTDAFGVLLARGAAEGRAELLVADGATSVTIAGPGYYLMPHALLSVGFRAVCVTEYAGLARGPGPRGKVYELRRDVPPVLVCFANVLGTSAWTRVELERGQGAGRTYALWALLAAPAPALDAPAEGRAISVLWVRDGLWDPAWWHKAGRDPRDVTVQATLTLGKDQTFSVGGREEFATYFEATMFAGTLVPGCEETMCGSLWNGLRLQTCPRVCAAGEACVNHECVAGTCAPIGREQACATDADLGARCGPAVDGCGGVLDCGGCPAGTTCGGGGAPGYCGRYRLTEARLRQLYADTDGRLCGTFADLAGGTVDLSAANRARSGRECPDGQTCRANLCAGP